MVVIFFGSQTGTAEDLATRTQSDIVKKLSVPCVVLDTDDYDMEELSQWKTFDASREWIVGFFMATYGEGEPTDNSADFYSWIMDGAGTVGDKGDQDDAMTEEQVCENINYFVFGLGNKTYEYFNAIARRLDKRLSKLGARRLGERGEGDDDARYMPWLTASMEEDYIKWAPGIVTAIGSHMGISVDSSSQQNQPHIPLFNLEFITHDDPFRGELTANSTRKWQHLSEGCHEEVNPAKTFDSKHPYYSRYLTSRPLFADAKDVVHFKEGQVQVKSKKMLVDGAIVTVPRQCYHIEFDLSASGLSYKTGDHLGVWANNDAGQVQKLGSLLKVSNLDDIVKLTPNPANPLSDTAKAPFPQPSSIRDILTYYVDILATTKQHHFLVFGKFATDEKERARLFDIAEKREEYVNLVESSQKTLACILEDFPSIKLPLSVALTEILRGIAVRYYSISSSSLESPNVVSVTAVVVRYPITQHHLKSSGKKRVVGKEGLTTSCLERLHEHRTLQLAAYSEKGNPPPLYLPVYIRSSNFRLPRDHSKPVIMVGPGTGVAPFRAFLRERVHIASQGTEVGPTWLFFGSRNAKSDNLYAEEFAALLEQIKEKELAIDLRVITAFSRDTDKKVYVQHRLQEYGAQVWEHLQTGYFYICG
ncbi:NADPH-cytochrome P450 reductase [Kappamyces sp. JEL0680]|nr:NADPH-cytochrome P450 reductase [Kappamyces sp. JEL0680]